MHEIYNIEFAGSPIRVYLSHVEATAILAEAGFGTPLIPQGCNTVTFYFQTPDGLQALAANQREFSPTTQDNEQELNGLTVAICLNPKLDLIDARALLQKWCEQMTGEK